MQFEQINEVVQVLSHYDGSKTRPLRFHWRNRTYHVAQVHGVWHEVQGRDRVFHFHVSTRESGSFELIYNHAAMSWRIGRVTLG
ncbi:MAG: hypothetical protein BWY83_02590 [bacterium ADurb.Bin478]|nr:MAG: hypothetical protein BWY83_02590 [bacterium ADurb.Bin478]